MGIFDCPMEFNPFTTGVRRRNAPEFISEFDPAKDKLVEQVEIRNGRMRVKAGGQWYVLPAIASD